MKKRLHRVCDGCHGFSRWMCDVRDDDLHWKLNQCHPVNSSSSAQGHCIYIQASLSFQVIGESRQNILGKEINLMSSLLSPAPKRNIRKCHRAEATPTAVSADGHVIVLQAIILQLATLAIIIKPATLAIIKLSTLAIILKTDTLAIILKPDTLAIILKFVPSSASYQVDQLVVEIEGVVTNWWCNGGSRRGSDRSA